MKPGSSLSRPASAQDQTLRWTMRIVGLMLAISSIVFINQDIFTSDLSWWFFGLCIGLGTITVVTSWLPDTKTQLQKGPVMQPASQLVNRYRKAA
jgi:hypothetical protein